MLPEWDKATWQRQIDEWFPIGTTVAYEEGEDAFPNPTAEVLRVPRVMVWRVEDGAVTLVLAPVLSHDSMVVEWRVVDLDVSPELPVADDLRVLRVVRDDGQVGFFTDYIPEGVRAESVRLREEHVWFQDAYMAEESS